VSLLLRIAALISLAWAVLLLACKDATMPADVLSPLTRALGNGLGVSSLVFAYLFWHGARDPNRNRGAVYCAIMLMALKIANDLYELLVLLSGAQALASLGDLVVSVGLLVGILEALPRTLKPDV